MSLYSNKIIPAFLMPGFLLGCLLAAPASAAGGPDQANARGRSPFSLRLSGSLAFPDAGDVNGMIRSYNGTAALINSNGQTAAVDWKEIKSAGEFSLELRYELSARIGLGLEGGFLRKKFPGTWSFNAVYSDVTTSYNESGSFGEELRTDNSFNVIPVVLSGYYYVLRGRLDLYIKGGIGVYFGRYELNETLLVEHDIVTEYYDGDGDYEDTNIDKGSSLYEDHGVAHAASLGLHSGLGLEWRLSDRLSFNLEGLFRTLDLTHWNGYLDQSFRHEYQTGYSSEDISAGASYQRTMIQGRLRCRYEQYSDGHLPDGGIFMKQISIDPDGYSGKRASVRLDGLSIKVGISIRI